jgi:hypothetical protein
MTHTIGKFNRASRSVPLTVTHNGVTVARPINACLTAEGKHDLPATRERAAAVARGIRHKIERGVILPS